MSLSTGDRLGSYEIRGPLGSGGMGVVYRARDPRLERDVAIKLLSAKGASDPDRLRRFEQEARAASALDHPNIITIHEIGETGDGQPYLVMQLVEGKSLRELIESHRLSLHEKLRIAIQIADGLSRAHRHGIVHRDLKPDNVMVNTDGLVKILDFGLAKLSEPAVGSELATIERAGPQTEEGRIVGTAQYMSPEQAQGESVDARSDIFSLGGVLYEMVTGCRPFQGDNAVAVLAEIVRKDPERASDLDPSLPVDLDKIIHRALRKDPERRFQNASDMKVALEELSEELDSGDALTASEVRAIGRKNKRRWPLTAAAAALGLAGVFAVTSMRSPDLPPMRILPMTTDAGFEHEPALSPDGRQLAFVKNRHIFVKLIGESEAVQLTKGDVNDVSPTWSPDGARIAFLRHVTTTIHDVLEVPAVGGTPRALGQMQGVGHGLSYSPDGKELAIVHRESNEEEGAIFLLSRETGALRRVTPPAPAGILVRFPKFSPDGKTIAFERVRDAPHVIRPGDIVLYDLVEDREKVLLSRPGLLLGFDFTADGRRIVFAVGKSWDSMHLESISIEGGETTMHLPGERAYTLSLARDTNRLVYEKNLEDWNIWRVSGPAATERRGPERVVGSTWLDMAPDLSPDGTKLAFMSGRSGDWEIWIADADGSAPHRLTNLGAAGVPRWSPDGSRIAFHAGVDGLSEIFVIDALGGFPRRLTDDTFGNANPAWSLDGHHIYFISERDGVPHLWKIPSEGGVPEHVLANAGNVWPIDGDELIIARDFGAWVLREGDATPSAVLEFNSWWAPWKNKIVFDVDDSPRFDVFDRDTGETTPLVELDESHGRRATLTVSADGAWVYYQQLDTSGSDIMLVENFVP